MNQLIGEESLRFVLLVSVPELALLSSAETFVVGAGSLVSLAEGWMASERDEEDDSSSEEIDLDSVVGALLDDFWGHVSLGSEDRFHFTGSVSSIEAGGKSEIGDLQVHLAVE